MKTTTINLCPGCGEVHNDMTLWELNPSEYFTMDNREYTRYGLCFKSGKIIFHSDQPQVVTKEDSE